MFSQYFNNSEVVLFYRISRNENTIYIQESKISVIRYIGKFDKRKIYLYCDLPKRQCQNSLGNGQRALFWG